MASPRMQDESCIGGFLKYDCGPLAGRCVRSELEEYQKPDLGRKFAKRDRRPLDPPPVVRLRMFELLDEGLPTQREQEIAADDIDISGLVAHLDLFPVPPPAEGQSLSSTNLPISPPTVNVGYRGQPSAPYFAAAKNQEVQQLQQQEQEQQQPPETPSSPPIATAPALPSTGSLFGSSFVHAVHMDWRGEPVVFFVFSDLSVRLEGYFCLRYRFFDLFSSRTVGSNDVPVAAELYSGGFVIYSTKEFPGLQASTPLTKHLSRWGVRVNLREGERRRANDSSADEDELGGDTPKGQRRGRPPGR